MVFSRLLPVLSAAIVPLVISGCSGYREKQIHVGPIDLKTPLEIAVQPPFRAASYGVRVCVGLPAAFKPSQEISRGGPGVNGSPIIHASLTLSSTQTRKLTSWAYVSREGGWMLCAEEGPLRADIVRVVISGTPGSDFRDAWLIAADWT
jgi:hypothetical protein